ncbi:protein kinase [Thermodesulfobacteriota bacterium]
MSATEKTPSLKNGTILNGKWEIIEHIATGGKGEVYHARQTSLDREVVVKTISKEYLAELDGDEEYIETELQRFHREALAMAQIRHPYIVQVYDQDESTLTVDGVEESVQYLVMEYIDGPDLRSTMPSEGFCESEAQAQKWIRKYFLPVLDGIQSIHDLGIVHRDIKPENVLLENSTPKIMDFGIAGGLRWSGLTKSHHVEGTITYMAPEQFLDLGETDVRGDVYALGKILYEAVIGKMDKKTACPLKSVSLQCTDTPFLKRLDLIVREATVEDQGQRIPSVKALKERLESLLEDFDESKLHFMGVALPRPGPKQIALALTLVGLVIGMIVVSNLIHHSFMGSTEGRTTEVLGDSSTIVGGDKNSNPGTAGTPGNSRASSITGKDGSILRVVPSGDFNLPSLHGSEAGKSFHVSPFYMGETEVTNAQYVEFLNQVLQRITVAGDAVKSSNHPWLILGNMFGGYEPIVYQNGKFLLKDPRYASYPVVQVTGYGASAYANFFGLRLPTEFQWYAAERTYKGSSGKPPRKEANPTQDRTDLEREMAGLVDAYGVLDKFETDASFTGPGPSRVPHNVSHFPPNNLGIRGLRANVGEWGLRSMGENPGSEHQPGFVILGGLEGTWLLGATLIRGPEQNPSEPLVSVGFRVVQEMDVQPRREE